MKKILLALIIIVGMTRLQAQVGGFDDFLFDNQTTDHSSAIDAATLSADDPRNLILSDTIVSTRFKQPMKFTKGELARITDPRIRDMYWYALNDTTDKKRYLRAHYAFNTWPDNWSFETRLGVQTVFDQGFEERFSVGPQLEFAFKKDLHPYWAARGVFTWSKYKHELYTPHPSTMTVNWEDYPGPTDWWQRVQYTNIGGRVEVMLNVLNLIAGREMLYSPFFGMVYAGAGGSFSAKTLGERDGSCFVPQWFVGGEACMNLTQRHVLTFDIHGSWQGDDLQGFSTQNSTWKISALLGVSYKFSRVIHFQRLGYDDNFDRQVVNNAADEGDIMESIIEEQHNQEVAELPSDMIQAAFFQIDRIELQHTYVLNLGFYARLINTHPQQKFLVKGFADIELGSLKRNLWLCEQRAKVVADVLVKTYGVNPDQLVVGGGDLEIDIPFIREQGHHKFNRCTIVCPLGKDYQIIKENNYKDEHELNDRTRPRPSPEIR